MKLSSFYSVLIGVVLVLLLVGGIGAVWLATGSKDAAPAIAAQPTQRLQKPSSTLTRPVSAASSLFISRRAAAVVSLLSNPEQLSDFWLTGLSATQRKTRQAELASLSQSLFAEFDLDYSRDLKPWLGDEATFAIMSADIDRDEETGLQPGYLLVLAVQNPQQAEESLQAFWRRQAGSDLITEQVAGIQLLSAGSSDSESEDLKPRLASAMVGNHYVLFANYPKVLRTALNNAQVSELSLEKSFSYQQALEQVSEPQAGFLFVNIPELSPDLNQRLANLLQLDLSPYDSLMLGLRPASQGLLANAVLLATNPAPSESSNSSANSIDASPLLRFIPTHSHFAIASRDLPQLWADSARSSKPDWQQSLTALQQTLGLPLAEIADLQPVLQGDFGLAQVPHPGRADDWLLVVQKSPDTEAALTQLDQLAQQQGMSLGSFQLADQTIYAWTKLKPSEISGAVSLQAEVQAVRTTFGDYALFATSLEALEQALSDSSATSLATSADFKAALNQLPPPNQGYLYLDRKALEQRLQSKPLLKTLLRSTQSALITRYGTDEIGQRAAAFLRLVD